MTPLHQLLRVLDAVPRRRLDMHAHWPRGEYPDIRRCLGSWAGTDPWFRANTAIGRAYDPDGYPLVDSPCGVMAGVLEVTEDDAATLLGGVCRSDPKAKDVRDNVERLIRGEPAEPYPMRAPPMQVRVWKPGPDLVAAILGGIGRGEDDATIAVAAGVMPAWVRRIRAEAGAAGGPPDFAGPGGIT